MVRIATSLLLAFSISTWAFAQEFSAERITEWNKAGNTTEVLAPLNQKTILDFGGDNTGTTNSNEAFELALASLNGSAGTIYFPEGDYFFTSALIIPDSVFLKGAGTDSKLKFDLGGNSNLIQITGSILPTEFSLAQNATKGNYTIELLDASGFEVGNFIRLYMNDEDLMFSSWAYGTLGQVIEVTEVNDNQLTLADPLNHNYPLVRAPFAKQINPICGAGIECLSIEREDNSVSQSSNIYFNAANNCVVRNVESVRCDFGHVEINSSAHISVEHNYFHHAIGYGGGGKGYGVIFQTASSFCLAEDNLFEHLRHSMLIQSGANGNVFAYNYSTNPFWETNGLPANSAGDAVLHGNYTYLNLFEGNTVQNMVIDASHGKNGPFNTFFRNRGELFGFFSDAGTPTDSMNVVGNEITNSGFPYGLFMLSGDGHYSFGNNVSGSCNPIGTSELEIESLFLESGQVPEYLAGNTLPMVGYSLSMNEKQLPAQQRFESGTPVGCNQAVVTSTSNESAKSEELLFMAGDNLMISKKLIPATVKTFTLEGRLLETDAVTSNTYNVGKLGSRAIYILQVIGPKGQTSSIKLLKN
ncbi:MAG: glycosyl hydrolase family 28-related protein [Flavobacteriales bacterium]